MTPEKSQLIAGRPRLLRVAEARAEISIGHTKFYELVKRGLIDVVKIGGATRVKSESLDRFISALSSGPPSRDRIE